MTESGKMDSGTGKRDSIENKQKKLQERGRELGRKNTVLISFVPTIAVEMIDTALKEGGAKPFQAPYKDTRFGVCGLLDISEFTKMSQTFGNIGSVGTEQIIKVLNRYFNQLIETLMEIDCDILKFAGDALLLYWPCGQDTIKEAVANATFQLISICEKTETFSPATENNVLAASDSSERRGLLEQTIQLFCHAGLTVGDLTFHILGGLHDRHEFVVSSPVLTTEIADSVEKSKVREVVVGPSAWEPIAHLCDFEERGEGYHLVKKIDWKCKKIDGAVTETNLSDPRAFALVRTFVPLPMHSFLDYEEKNVLGEFRDIVVLFAGFNPTGSLQDLFYNVQELTRKNSGMIRQFILDDKGYVVICGWGLPKFTARNPEQLAVTTGLAFTNPAQLGHAANVTVGITFGRVYCGQVGGEMRKEYAMVGDTVNTAARLMASKASPMLVDYHVKTSTSSSFNFEHLEPILFKGKSAPMPVFVPHIKEFKKGARQDDIGFYGQEDIKKTLTTAVEGIHKAEKGEFHLISGNSGMGKSMVMKFLINKCAEAEDVKTAQFCGRQIEQDTSFFLLAEMFHHFAPQDHGEQKVLVTEILDKISPDKKHQQNLLFPAMAYLLRLQWVFDPESESPATVFHSSTTIPMIERSSAIKQVERAMTKYITDNCLPNIEVLIIDDCQFFDPNSFDVLHSITDAMVKRKLVVVMFTRPPVTKEKESAEILKLKSLTTTNEPLKAFEQDLVSEILNTKVQEHAEETSTEVSFAPGSADFDEVLALIMRESKGNPFWVMNFVNIFKIQVVKGEHKQMFDTSFNKSQAFGILNRVILIEFDGYSSAQQELLKTASTIGTVFEIRILKKVLPVTFRRKHNFETQMKLLVEIGVIQNYDHEKKDWFCEFVHDLTRRAIESLIPPSKLSMIHKQVAETYEYFYQDDLRPLFPRLAYHYDKSGMSNESFVYLRLAATTELQLDSVQQGMEMLERAIAVINNNNENLESKMQKVEQLVMLLRSCLKDAGFSEDFLISEREKHDSSMAKSLSHLTHTKYSKLLTVLRALQDFQKQGIDDAEGSSDNVLIKRKVSSWKIMPALQDGPDDASKSKREDGEGGDKPGEDTTLTEPGSDPRASNFCTVL